MKLEAFPVATSRAVSIWYALAPIVNQRGRTVRVRRRMRVVRYSQDRPVEGSEYVAQASRADIWNRRFRTVGNSTAVRHEFKPRPAHFLRPTSTVSSTVLYYLRRSLWVGEVLTSKFGYKAKQSEKQKCQTNSRTGEHLEFFYHLQCGCCVLKQVQKQERGSNVQEVYSAAVDKGTGAGMSIERYVR